MKNMVMLVVSEPCYNGPEDVSATDSLFQQLWCKAVTSALHWRSGHCSFIPAQVSSSNTVTSPCQQTAKSGRTTNQAAPFLPWS